ncbi:hypothetical protein PVK06_047250 [Gossypium arboreum]|uniref:Uncharacterized protein n=1 Tax=Gossypium arboreum TaxID=29729 RepID=A0ABR0MCV2_GOSAR|nr:hypothetical protein PVK06_047250 [Gossypium arboreum]
MANSSNSTIANRGNPLFSGSRLVRTFPHHDTNTYALLEPSGSAVPEAEKFKIILVGLSSDYDAVLTLASFSFNYDYSGPFTLTMAPATSSHAIQGSLENIFTETGRCPSAHGGLISFSVPRQYISSSMVAPMTFSYGSS